MISLKYSIFLFFLSGTNLLAAPHPLTSSSIVNQTSNPSAFSQMGFSLELIPENWSFTKNIYSSQDTIEIGADSKTLLSFRSESVSVRTQLETYVRQYLRDYNQYGFEVIGLQSHAKSYVPSVIVDLKQKNKLSKSRQVFFYKQNKMIIATCTDDLNKFDQTLAICNRILSRFKWN